MRTFKQISKEISAAQGIHDVASLTKLAAEIQELGTPEALARGATALGTAARVTGDFSGALKNLMLAQKIRLELGDRMGAADASGNLANVYNDMGDYPHALEQYGKALETYEEFGEQFQAAIVTGNLGIVYNSTGDYPRALEHNQRAQQLFEELGNKPDAATIVGNIASVYFNTGDYESAIEHYKKGVALQQEVGNKLGLARALGGLATAYTGLGDYAQALEQYESSLSLDKEHGNTDGVALTYCNMCELMLNHEEFARAQEILDKLSTMFMASVEGRVEVLVHTARLADHHEDYPAAKESLTSALDLAEESGVRPLTVECHKRLRDLAKKQNDFEAYIRHNDEHQRISEEIRGKEATQKMAMMEAERKIEGERKEREKERALLYGALPKAVADRMLSGEDVSGDHFDHASVMFLDVVGFTTNSHDLEPRIVTELLDSVFHSFDDLCDQHNVTKIKTIGDAYLAVAFTSDEAETSTEQNIASVALEIQKLEFAWPDGSPLQFRIGLHSGPVVAGVIGKQRLQYDVWGDTVNTASRMESTGEASKIHCSEAFARSSALRAKDDMAASSRSVSEGVVRKRGEIEIKGKGTMKTYWLEGA